MTIKVAEKKDRKKFFRQWLKRARRSRHPFHVLFELTYRCNFRCPHCYLPGSPRKKNELTTRQVFAVLEALKKAGVYDIGFTGGEPLLRKDIFRILDYANRCGFRIGVLTNGCLINKKTAQALKRVNVNKCEITFNAATAKTFERLTGAPESLRKVKRAVKLLNKQKVQVVLKSTVTRINQEEIPSIGRFARRLGIPFRIDGEITPCRDQTSDFADAYSVSHKEFETMRRTVYPELFRKDGFPTKSSRRKSRVFNCSAGTTSFVIDPYGRMNLCAEISYPGYPILTKGITASWNSLKKIVAKINRSKKNPCKKCDLFYHCGWCAGRSYLEKGRFDHCSEYFKTRALERINLTPV